MKVLDVLRKLGIVRFGAKAAVYRNANERPTEFVMDHVFDAEKDPGGRPRTWVFGGRRGLWI